jgi:hypothetical protein
MLPGKQSPSFKEQKGCRNAFFNKLLVSKKSCLAQKLFLRPCDTYFFSFKNHYRIFLLNAVSFKIEPMAVFRPILAKNFFVV